MFEFGSLTVSKSEIKKIRNSLINLTGDYRLLGVTKLSKVVKEEGNDRREVNLKCSISFCALVLLGGKARKALLAVFSDLYECALVLSLEDFEVVKVISEDELQLVNYSRQKGSLNIGYKLTFLESLELNNLIGIIDEVRNTEPGIKQS